MVASAGHGHPFFLIKGGYQPVRRVPCHFPHGLVHGRQLGPGGPRYFRIVEPRYRYISRDCKTEIASGGNRGDGHVVVLGKDRCGARGATEQFERDAVANFIGEVASHDEPFVNGTSRLPEGLPIAFHSSFARGVRGVAEDDADAPVPKPQYMGGDRLAGGNLVHRDDYAAVEIAVRRYPGVGELLALEDVEQLWLIAGRWREQDAVESGAQEKLAELFRPTRDMVEGEHQKSVAAVFEPTERAVLQFDDIAWTGPFVGQADQIGSTRDEALRGDIRVIVERSRSLLDLPAYRFADMRGIVERARDCLRSDPCDPRDIDDR